MKLRTHPLEKPWGRLNVPATFNMRADKKIGEIWYDDGNPVPLPLLVKWLFTSEKLSIQVHPNDAQARASGQKSGKEECWYIVDVQPGAVLGIGTKIPLDASALKAAAIDGSIESLMDWKPVKAGDFYYIPAGTVHAIGAGITLVEVQQYADITYRIYDYGRPRELHLTDGVAVAIAKPYDDIRSGNAIFSEQLANGPHFNLWLVTDNDALASLASDQLRWITPLSGQVYVGSQSAAAGDCLLVQPGEVITMDSDARFLWAVSLECLA